MEFKRDYDKYLVLKWDDIRAFLSDRDCYSLDDLCKHIDKCRAVIGKTPNSYVVVNEDEPYAEQVWELIKQGEEGKS